MSHTPTTVATHPEAQPGNERTICIRIWDGIVSEVEHIPPGWRVLIRESDSNGIEDADGRIEGHDYVDRLYAGPPAPEDHTGELRGALSNLLEQVYQMRGLFDDEDGAIAAAVEGAERALARINAPRQG